MSRVVIKALGGALTVAAALGAWSLGKKTGRKVARATTPPPTDPETGERIEEAEEVETGGGRSRP